MINMKKHLVFLYLAITAAGQLSAEEIPPAATLPDYPQIAVTTNAGSFVIELFTGRAPLTVSNFLQYVNSGFYEGTVFHRIVGGFVAQAGGYDADYKLKQTGPMVSNEAGNGLSNRRGYVAMARTTDPHSANSQFYINLADNLALDPMPTRWGYTVFGRVIEGMDTIDEIGYRATGPGPIPSLTKDVPVEPIIIEKMELLPDDNGQNNSAEAPATE
jgi:cyclophilin family peptidyl-prolyl cis-trans isomerase